MTSDAGQDEASYGKWMWGRLFAVFVLLLLAGLGCLGLQYVLSVDGDAVAITYSLLFALPYSLGAVAALLTDPSGDKSRGHYVLVPTFLILAVLVLGGVLIREGVICMIMLAPLWWVSGLLGSLTVRMLHRQLKKRTAVNCCALIALPFAFMVAEGFFPAHTDQFVVTREVVVDAPPEEVWPHLLRMEDIDENEGIWNITQNLFGVPRPTAAVVVGEGANMRRLAEWGDDVSFEEHVAEWEEARRLNWAFHFPNRSVQNYTDRHISPDGRHLKIISGGYRLERIGEETTRLILETRFSVTTPVNTYGGLWAELLLGDIQANVLKIVKDRAETRSL